MSVLKCKKLKQGETIEISITMVPSLNIHDGDIIKVEVVKVHDWYDEDFDIDGACNINEGMVNIDCKCTLDKGLYLILCLKNIEGAVIAGYTHDTTRILDAFIVDGTSEMSPIEMYQSVVNNRNELFCLPKYKSDNEGSIPFDVAIFIKNINVDVQVNYGDIELIPYKKYSLLSEVEYINGFLLDVGYDLKFDVNKYCSNRPAAVFRITNIYATSDDEAVDFAIKRAGLVNNLFTLMMQGNGSFFAVVVFDKNKKAAQFRPIQPNYVGNLLKWINQGHFIRTYYDALKDSNSYLKLYIKLLTDAMNEEDKIIKYYRLWIVLEGIASIKNYEKEEMKKWNGDVVKNKKGDTVYVGYKSLDIVFELIRRSSLYSEDFFKVESITTPKEFLSVCYQRRCCAAHHGSCVCEDLQKCNLTKKEMKRCSENMIIHGNPKDVFSDKILWNLQLLTFSIVKNEMEQTYGKVIKETDYISRLIQ